VCFIGRVAYEKYIGSKDFSFGWQEPINKSRIFVMHFPLRGEAIVRTRELRDLVQATPGPNKHERLSIAKTNSGGVAI
jgi:TDG/mug DNA glycosylase family protein